MYWLEVSVVTDGEAAEAVSEALLPFAYRDGVVLEQLADPEALYPEALEPAVTVKIYLPEHEDSPALRRRIEEVLYHLSRLYPVPAPTFRQLKEEDWVNAWKQHYRPFRIGRRLWIQPSWIEVEPLSESEPTHMEHHRRLDDVVVTLDPGMAFGTGLHPTTQMCLQALEQLVQPGMKVLDLGTGSGILAIAGARLGAAAVLAVDTDQLAVRTALENAVKNRVENQITVNRGSLAEVSDRDWDVVVVNILAPVIEAFLRENDLLDYINDSGRLILSGIIDQQAAGVNAAVAAAGGEIAQTLTMRDWVSFIIVKNKNARLPAET